MEAIRWEQDQDGVVLLTIDDPAQSANTMNERFVDSLKEAVERLESERDSIAGVIVTSAKKTFFAGGDLNDLIKARQEDAPEIAEMVRNIKALLRRLEKLGHKVTLEPRRDVA
jgi:3-hydroxyacyl-CoA dehydrogenase/enoyl-CoA hydratase/3-hydroxybutyryl-CoA epimerase